MELSKEQRLLSTILNEAWENETFKDNLMSNPVEAIEELTGQKISVPAGKRLIVRDQSNPDEIYINIPQRPVEEDMELDEAQLDVISGGGPTPPKITDPAANLNGLLDG